jgi:cytochrome P450
MNKEKAIHEFSMTDPETASCPHAYYAAMRETSPVHRDPGTGYYWVSRYEDIVAAALDTERFSSFNEITLRKTYSPRVMKVWEDAGIRPIDTLITEDPPLHDDQRRLGMTLFPPPKVRELTPQIESLVNELIDGFIDNGETDFLANFAGLLPATIVADEYGFPRADQPQFRAWTDAIIGIQTPGLSEERQIELVNKIIELFRYLNGHLKAAAENGTNRRVMHTLATMNKRDGSPFTLLERGWMAVQVFVGGNETTVNTLMMGMRKLAMNPDLQDQLRADPEKIAPFVEEILRTEGPVQSLIRTATRDIEVAGTTIPKGAHVILCSASGNRDENQWPDADEFRLDRKDGNRHLSFGRGRHACLGMHLARRELNIAFEALVRRLDNIRLKGRPEDIEQLPLPFHRAIGNLEIVFDKMG